MTALLVYMTPVSCEGANRDGQTATRRLTWSHLSPDNLTHALEVHYLVCSTGTGGAGVTATADGVCRDETDDGEHQTLTQTGCVLSDEQTSLFRLLINTCEQARALMLVLLRGEATNHLGNIMLCESYRNMPKKQIKAVITARHVTIAGKTVLVQQRTDPFPSLLLHREGGSRKEETKQKIEANK